MRVNFHYFFLSFLSLFVKNPSVEGFICINLSFAMKDFIQINSY